MPNPTYGTNAGITGSIGSSTADTARRAVEGTTNAVKSGYDKTVKYFRDNDARAIGNDVKSYLQSHPTQALIGAAVLGVIAGRMMRRG